MHTVELYERAKQVAETMDYDVREENLGGVGGGACEVAGRKCLFVDVTMSAGEQLDQVVRALQRDPKIHVAEIPEELRDTFFPPRRAAA